MATGTAYGANFTIANNPTPSTVLEAGKWNGKVRVQVDIITLVAQLDAGSHLYCGKVPKGAIPLGSKIKYTTGSATATLKIGSIGDDDMFGTFSDINATNEQESLAVASNARLAAETDILVLTATANMLTNDVLEVQLFYSVE